MRRADDHRPWSVRPTPAGLRPGDRPSAGARRTAGRLPAAAAEREPRPIHQQGSKDPSQPVSWRIARLAARLVLRALNAPYQSPNVTCSGKSDESATARKLAGTVSLNSRLSAAGISCGTGAGRWCRPVDRSAVANSRGCAADRDGGQPTLYCTPARFGLRGAPWTFDVSLP